ncbi:hypothetical protein DPMN_136693 [Dreissena polymorpha]|uniref:Uncharacterized protein n=1 Tax=Dreissena polymorpha TaxID=45954 RepID=A0A9D4JE10_DREPO|nr:hypothetical protein DPMN_136693 [Dreissena polymorpha]
MLQSTINYWNNGIPIPIVAGHLAQSKDNYIGDGTFIVNKKHQVLLSTNITRMSNVDGAILLKKEHEHFEPEEDIFISDLSGLGDISLSGPAVQMFKSDNVFALYCP